MVIVVVCTLDRACFGLLRAAVVGKGTGLLQSETSADEEARHRNLCDQPRMVFQNNARPKMDPVRLIEPEKKLNSGQRTGEAKVDVADQRLCFNFKKTGHIARYCTAVDTAMRKAGAEVVLKATEVKTAEVEETYR
ncbi:hypothetical protein ElyMa_001574800 [Elysia marginata]|uniref:Uncharacterized protein n=1 Tax=Elysia marginata TaxID=1093978 RepID=A0AAV4JEV3_9GAST|nr:hypothetical protein ElyMa_001574800 [Elysia marginata]